jgi:excisionase family DNA binding protein
MATRIKNITPPTGCPFPIRPSPQEATLVERDSIPYPPRGLSREEAARYVGVGPSTFDKLIEEGRMPKPLRVGKRVIWDRLKVEAAFAELDEEAGENSIDRALRVAGGRR